MKSDLTVDQWRQIPDITDEPKQTIIGEIAEGDQERCGYTVHANGDWADYRCEMMLGHPGPHAIGLRHHAMPLVNDLKAKPEAMEEELRILQGSHDTWVKQYGEAQAYIDKLEMRIGFAAQAIPVSLLTREGEDPTKNRQEKRNRR